MGEVGLESEGYYRQLQDGINVEGEEPVLVFIELHGRTNAAR